MGLSFSVCITLALWASYPDFIDPDKVTSLDFPLVPFELTTFEQDDLILMIQKKKANTTDLSLGQIYEKLIDDETLPMELRYWTVRHYITNVKSRESFNKARAFLKEHGADESNAVIIRYLLAKQASDSIQLGDELYFKYEELKAIYADFFSNCPSDHVLALWAHINYSKSLEERSRVISECHQNSLEHANMAIDSAKSLLGRDDLANTERNWVMQFIKRLEGNYAKLLSEKGPEREYNYEESAIERSRESRKEIEENERIFDMYRKEYNLREPGRPDQYWANGTSSWRDPGYQSYKAMVLEREKKEKEQLEGEAPGEVKDRPQNR